MEGRGNFHSVFQKTRKLHYLFIYLFIFYRVTETAKETLNYFKPLILNLLTSTVRRSVFPLTICKDYSKANTAFVEISFGK